MSFNQIDEIKNCISRYLSIREHSKSELFEKLYRKKFDQLHNKKFEIRTSLPVLISKSGSGTLCVNRYLLNDSSLMHVSLFFITLLQLDMKII